MIGDGFKSDADKLKDLSKYAEDKTVLDKVLDIKKQNKIRLAKYIKDNNGIDVDPNSIFDVQVKRYAVDGMRSRKTEICHLDLTACQYRIVIDFAVIVWIELLPRVYQIVCEINHRFTDELWAFYPNDYGKVDYNSILAGGQSVGCVSLICIATLSGRVSNVL